MSIFNAFFSIRNSEINTRRVLRVFFLLLLVDSNDLYIFIHKICLNNKVVCV